MKIFVQILLFIFPWFIRRYLLKKIFGFNLEKGSYIGLSIILAKEVKVGQQARIGHLTFCKEIDKLELGAYSNIGNRNYITGFSVTSPAVLRYGHFSHKKGRKCELIIG